MKFTINPAFINSEVLIKCFGCFQVLMVDFFMADQLTSQVKPPPSGFLHVFSYLSLEIKCN